MLSSKHKDINSQNLIPIIYGRHVRHHLTNKQPRESRDNLKNLIKFIRKLTSLIFGLFLVARALL
jgi:hypothetical protein